MVPPRPRGGRPHGVHLHRGRLGGDGGRPATLGDPGRPQDGRRRDAHARPRRPLHGLHVALLLPGSRRRLAALAAGAQKPHGGREADAGRRRLHRAGMSDLFTLPNAVAGLIVVALNGYVLLGGADFGGGVWDLLASGPRRDRQRALIADAIGPIWEANHVWLIIVIVLLFTCFPPAFAALSITLHIPLTLMLIGIVLRGSAFTFRAHHGEDSAMPLYWGRVFAIASAATPVFLGICLGAVASGDVPRMDRADFYGGFIAPWLTPFCLAVGALT